MFLTFSLSLTILFWENYALEETLNKKNLKFVNNLKQDLRRNNDDYAEFKRSQSQTYKTLPTSDHLHINDMQYRTMTTHENKKVTKLDHDNFKTNSEGINITESNIGRNNNDKKDVRIKIIDNIRRRVNNALISKEIIKKDNKVLQKSINNEHKVSHNNGIFDNIRSTPRSLWIDMHNLYNKNNYNDLQYQMKLLANKKIQLPQVSTIKTTYTTNLKKNKVKQKHANKNQLEKFKTFIQKNKGLLREFISSKKHAITIARVTPSIQQKLISKQSLSSKSVINKKVTYQEIYDAGENNLNLKKKLEELPNGAVLDMFPAKGGRIHSKRVRGHLCHRHALIPEGPKYDSRGQIYLPPHAAANIAHEYNATDVPKLLLPRCCNCCRKSVLGCE